MVGKNTPITQESQVALSEFDFSHSVGVPADVMMREIGGEAVIVNLDSESYFGLDDVGTHMWTLLTESKSVQAAFDVLKDDYDVAEEQLRSDLSNLLHQLVDHGLLVLRDVKAV
jgi:hypothetical protein